MAANKYSYATYPEVSGKSVKLVSLPNTLWEHLSEEERTKVEDPNSKESTRDLDSALEAIIKYSGPAQRLEAWEKDENQIPHSYVPIDIGELTAGEDLYNQTPLDILKKLLNKFAE